MTVEIMPGMIFSEVGDGFYGYKIAKAKDGEQFLVRTDRVGNTEIVTSLKAYPGNWTFLFCTADASEEQAAGIVESQFDTYLDYEEVGDKMTNFYFATAKESLQSLLSSKGLNNCAVLKKIN